MIREGLEYEQDEEAEFSQTCNTLLGTGGSELGRPFERNYPINNR